MQHKTGKSLLSLLLLLSVLLLVSCNERNLFKKQPIARDGVLDLRQWNFDEEGVIPLNGEWSFYWQELLQPSDFRTRELPDRTGFILVPGRWNGYKVEDGAIPGSGFATFRLHIISNPGDERFALKILDMATAYKLWINDRLVASNGRVGSNSEQSKPQYLPQVASFPIHSENTYLTLQVSNFDHKKGGVWEPIRFGKEDDIRKIRTGKLAFELFLAGSLMVMALYHLGLFVLRRSDRSTLYFSLVCFDVALRTLLVGERFFIWLFPGFNWELFQKMEYLTLYLGCPLFYLFVSALFKEVSKRLGSVVVGISMLFSLFTLVTPAVIFSHGVFYYQLLMLVLFLYAPYVLGKIIIRKREGAVLVALGISIFVATVIYEILAHNEMVYSISLASVGLFVFIFIHSLMLSMRFSKAFALSEMLSEKLEQKVEERTRGLRQAHEEIVTANRKLKETQLQLVQSQKMEAMGTLAGGIAHEFNNILGTIIGYADMLINEVRSGSILKEGLTAISQSGNRAAELVRQILTFSRADSQEMTPILIQSSIDDMLKVIRTTLPESIKMQVEIEEDCHPIMANKTQLSQILLNLSANAVHAMREEGGILRVELKEKHLREEALPEGFTAGPYVELSVTDTGTGMSEAVKHRIFDPFYTTKEVNEGTGLGLSIVHGIVKSHFGFIDVDSAPGKGTTFRICFPVTREQPVIEPEIESRPTKGKGHILIVEDEKDLLNLYRVMMTKLGYQTAVFNNGVEALEHFKSQPDRYDLVFTDQMMPTLNGFDMSLEILKIRPDIPIIITTGYSQTVSPEAAKKAGIRHFMTKPVRISELSHKISELI